MDIYQCPNCHSDETHFLMDSTYKCESCSHYFDRSEAIFLAQDCDDFISPSDLDELIKIQTQAAESFDNNFAQQEVNELLELFSDLLRPQEYEDTLSI
jgi:hypothetical protein